jgi:hypothetical protein
MRIRIQIHGLDDYKLENIYRLQFASKHEISYGIFFLFLYLICVPLDADPADKKQCVSGSKTLV